MRMRGIAVFTAVGLLTLPALADAGSSPVATGVRFGDHPAFTRVVLDFAGRISARKVEAGRVWTSSARVRVAGATTNTTGATGQGVKVALQPGTQTLRVLLSFAARRFKYLSYTVVTGNRLAIDLWKSKPPTKPTQTCRGLSLRRWLVRPGVVTVTGRERGIFENQFRVVVRGAHGKILGRRRFVGPGSWGGNVRYSAARHQAGTLEAVAFSAKDGALECLAQVRVTLPAS